MLTTGHVLIEHAGKVSRCQLKGMMLLPASMNVALRKCRIEYVESALLKHHER